MGKKSVTDQLSSRQQAIGHLDRMVPEAMRVLEKMLKDDTNPVNQMKAVEIVVKKTFPDKQEVSDLREKPALLTQIEQFIKRDTDGEKVG